MKLHLQYDWLNFCSKIEDRVVDFMWVESVNENGDSRHFCGSSNYLSLNFMDSLISSLCFNNNSVLHI